jgi:hypothetical protein
MPLHPVQLQIARPQQLARVHIVIRLALLVALGFVGCSSLYWVMYLVLPAIAALLIVRGGGDAYLRDRAPRAIPVLKWLAGGYAYLWLLTDEPPPGGDAVQLDVEVCGTPTPRSALIRLVTSLPALLLLFVLSLIAGVLWVLAALYVLVRQRPWNSIADFQTMTLRYQFRLIAYHLSLVDRYPSLGEGVTRHQVVPAH